MYEEDNAITAFRIAKAHIHGLTVDDIDDPGRANVEELPPTPLNSQYKILSPDGDTLATCEHDVAGGFWFVDLPEWGGRLTVEDGQVVS